MCACSALSALIHDALCPYFMLASRWARHCSLTLTSECSLLIDVYHEVLSSLRSVVPPGSKDTKDAFRVVGMSLAMLPQPTFCSIWHSDMLVLHRGSDCGESPGLTCGAASGAPPGRHHRNAESCGCNSDQGLPRQPGNKGGAIVDGLGLLVPVFITKG